ncbi:MAG: hypothetical protein ACT6RD_15450 [Brevundimonas sp.]|uniref:hypothetical protein n=1 Tax=Brevundimonas sp. TaxID=1871086 RepID=UPI0040348011
MSLKPNSGPVTSHTTMSATARAKTRGRPLKRAAALAKREYRLADFGMVASGVFRG